MDIQSRHMVSDSDIYFFDLQGYLHLKGALDHKHVEEMNAILDSIPLLESGQWHGYIHAHDYGDVTSGTNLQQIYEASEPFERLIDHPAWIEKVKYFVGGEDTFDWTHGPLFIDENLVSLRCQGEAIGIHSGGHAHTKRNQYRVKAGHFMCGQVNILMALTEIGPGDGGTVLIPGSHKSNFPPPNYEVKEMAEGASAAGVDGGIEVFMEPGDALLFTDAMCHGSAKRTNDGERRICVYRYGPSWGFFRHGYRPSQDLLKRLTPERRQIVWPHESLKPPDQQTYFAEVP